MVSGVLRVFLARPLLVVAGYRVLIERVEWRIRRGVVVVH